MGKMDAQMKAMHAMHAKMMRAKTPEERSALMAEHMNVMRKGMAMMNDTSKPGMGTGPMAMQGASDMEGHHEMMEKRMAMMASMMQMMMDRLPESPEK